MPLLQDQTSNGRPLSPLALRTLLNDRGMALFIAIFLLATMSLLGIMLLSTTTSELHLSGNYRMNQESFYAADRAIEYSYRHLPPPSPAEEPLRLDEAVHRDRITSGRSGLESSLGGDTRNTIEFLGAGPPPLGSGSDVTMFESHVYSVRVVGISPLGGANPARSDIRTQVGKIVPR